MSFASVWGSSGQWGRAAVSKGKGPRVPLRATSRGFHVPDDGMSTQRTDPSADTRFLPPDLRRLFHAERICDIDTRSYHGEGAQAVEAARKDADDSTLAAIVRLENIVEELERSLRTGEQSRIHEKAKAQSGAPNTIGECESGPATHRHRPLYCAHALSRLAVALLEDELSVAEQAELYLSSGDSLVSQAEAFMQRNVSRETHAANAGEGIAKNEDADAGDRGPHGKPADPKSPAALQVPETLDAPETPGAPEAPAALQVPETLGAPEAPEAHGTPDISETPDAYDAHDTLLFERAPSALFHAHMGLSDLYQRLGDFSGARAHADRCIALAPTTADAYFRKADVLAEQRLHAQAANVLLSGLRCAVAPQDCSLLYYYLGLLLWNVGKRREAAAVHVYNASLAGEFAEKSARVVAGMRTRGDVPVIAHASPLAAERELRRARIPVAPVNLGPLVAQAAIGLASAGAPEAAAPYAAILAHLCRNDRVVVAACESIVHGSCNKRPDSTK